MGTSDRKQEKEKEWAELKAFGKKSKVVCLKRSQSQERKYYTKLMCRLASMLDPHRTGSRQPAKTQRYFWHFWKKSKYGKLVRKGKPGFTEEELWKEAMIVHANFRKKTPIDAWSSKNERRSCSKGKPSLDKGVLPFSLFAIYYLE